MAEICERHVQAIWYDAALRPERLVTRRGCEVRVVSPGEWNLEAGPDFRRAVLELGPEPASLPPGAVSIWIGRYMTANTSFSLDQIDLAAYPYECRPLSENLCEEAIGHDCEARVRRDGARLQEERSAVPAY